MTSPLPTVVMEECSICYLDYSQDRKRRSLAVCGHVICSCCLTRLAARSGEVTCPFCRMPSTLPCDHEGEGNSDVAGPLKWLKRLYKKSKAGSRHRGSLAHKDMRDMALMCSYLV